MADSYKVGEAPWETGGNNNTTQAAAPTSFKVGEAPWEKYSGGGTSGDKPGLLDKVKNLYLDNIDPRQDLETAKAVGMGAANGAALGYAPQIYGAVAAIPDAIKNTSADDIRNVVNNYQDAYAKNRDQAKAVQDNLSQQHPYAYGAGALTGALLAPIPGATELAGFAGARGVVSAVRAAKALKEAPALAKIAMGAGKAGAIGFAANPGDQPGGGDRRLVNGAMGLGFGAGGEAIAQGIENSPETIDSIRRWMTAKQLGANKGQVLRLLKETGDGTTKLDQLEPYMDEHGMLNMGTTYSGVVDKSDQLMNEQGQKIGGIYSGVQNTLDANPEVANQVADTALHGPDLANEFFDSEKKLLQKQHNGKAALQKIKSSLGIDDGPVPALQPGETPPDPSGLTALGPHASLKDVHDYRMGVDDQIPWQADDTGKLVAQSNKRLRAFLNDKMQERVGAVDEATGQSNLPELLDANKSYSNAATINKISTSTKANEIAKQTMGGLMSGAGGVGTAIYSHDREGDSYPKAILKGIGTALAIRGARAVGPALTYRGATAIEPYLEGASNYVQQHPGVMGQALTAPWVTMTQENKK